MAERLSKAILARELAKPITRERVIFDETVPGFGVRLRPDRSPAFILAFKLRGRNRKITLGGLGEMSLDEAREKAREARKLYRASEDPVALRREKKARRLTFGELLDLYLADLEGRANAGKRRGRRSSVAESRRLASKRIVPSLGSIEVEALTVEQVTRWHARQDAPSSANRAATTARAAWRFGMRRGLVGQTFDPFAAIVKFEERMKRERYSLPELEKVGAKLREAEAAGTISPAVALALRLFALAGLRRSEVLGHAEKARRSEGDVLRWGDVLLDEGILRLRRAKAGARDVVLASPLLDALRKAKAADADASAPVCAPRRGTGVGIRVEPPLHALFASAGVPWRGLHAFRRTFGSVAGEQGFGEFIVGALLGHSASSVTGGYVIPSADPLRAAAERVAGEIAAALDGRRAEVVEFDRSKSRRDA